jgi:hypothetical protein
MYNTLAPCWHDRRDVGPALRVRFSSVQGVYRVVKWWPPWGAASLAVAGLATSRSGRLRASAAGEPPCDVRQVIDAFATTDGTGARRRRGLGTRSLVRLIVVARAGGESRDMRATIVQIRPAGGYQE